jgi:transposase
MPIPLRTDFDAVKVRAAARIGGVTLQIVRDRVLKFNVGGPDRLIDRKAPGQPSLLTATHRAALVEAIERAPMPAAHGVVRWRIIDLAQLLWDDFLLSVSRPTLSRELRALGYRKLSARPKHHAQDPEAIEALKRGALPPSWTRSERPSRADHR